MTTLNGQGVSRGTALGKVAFYRRSGQEIEPSAISDVPAELGRRTYADGMKAAAVIVTMLPIMCVYPFLQKYFAKGVMIGAIKS